MPITTPDRFHNVTLAGNTAGVLAEVSSGTLTLAGGNNITLSQAGNAITISGAAAGGGALSAGISTNGNTSGDTGLASQRLVFAGGNNITLSGSTNGGSMTLTISGPNAGGAQTGISGLANSETTYTSGSVTFSALGAITIRSTTGQHFQFSVAAQSVQAEGTQTIGMSNIGNTSGNTTPVSGTGVQIVFAGGNNITLSQSTNGSSATITISAANETQTVAPIGTQVFSVATANSTGTITRFAPEDHRHGGVVNVQIAGNTSNTSNTFQGSLVLAGGNNITLSQVTGAGGATITISAASQTAESNTIGMSNIGNTAGDTAIRSAAQLRIVLAGGNNITLSQSTNGSSATITISAFNQTSPVVGADIASVSSATNSGTATSQFAAEDHVHAGVGPAGVSTVGNTSGDTGTQYGRFILAGGNNITLSVSSSNNGAQTITISGANVGGAQTGISGIANSQTTYTSGTVSFSELGAITIRSTTGQQYQFSVAAQTVESNTIGMSNIGNTAGNTAIRSGPQLQVVFAGGNNITLSQSTNGSSATITVSAFNQTSPVVGADIASVSSATNSGTATSQFAAEDHVHAGVGPLGVSTLGNTAGDTGTQYGRVVLAGGNNITLSVSSSNNGAQTITISGGAGGGYTFSGGMSTNGNTSGDTGYATQRLNLIGGNNITLSGSTNAGSMSITISAGAGAGMDGGVSTGGNTSGNTGVVTGRLVLAGGNNITLSGSTNGGSLTVTVSGPASVVVPVISHYHLWGHGDGFGNTNMGLVGASNGTLWVFPLQAQNDIFPGNMTVEKVIINMSYTHTNATATTQAHSSTVSFGIYTMLNATSLNLLCSGSTSWGTNAANNSISSLYNGVRWLTIDRTLFNTSVTLSNTSYWGAINIVTAGTSVPAASGGVQGVKIFLNQSNRSGMMFSASASAASHAQAFPWVGFRSASTAGIPGGLAMSDMVFTSTQGYGGVVPDVRFIDSNGTSLYGIF